MTGTDEDLVRFVKTHTRPVPSHLCPEIEILQAEKMMPLWWKVAEKDGGQDVPIPYWAFTWPGSEALARFVTDRPIVEGKTVLDFASGGGLSAIASSMSGAKRVVAVDLDPLAVVACRLNAAANGVEIDVVQTDLVGEIDPDWDVVLAGDVCYDCVTSSRVTTWLRHLASRGVLVLLADPGRAYVPREGLLERARYVIPTRHELEGRLERLTLVSEVLAG